MTVEQVDRTKNSVTINVSGLTGGDRQTSVYIPGDVDRWYTLWDAKTAGYVSNIVVADYGNNNGDITIVMSSKYLKIGAKFVELEVANVNNGDDDHWVRLVTFLKFEYHNEATNGYMKYSDEDIDITVEDMREINDLARTIRMVCVDDDFLYYPLDDVASGDPILADYLKLPAQNILQSVDALGTWYSFVYDSVYYIVKNCKSGADFKPEFFNEMYFAINYFNLEHTYNP